MAAIKLYEGYTGAMPFIVDRSKKSVTESQGGRTLTHIPGRFSLCDSVNGNGRRYPKKVWEKNLSENSPLLQTIAKNAAFGLLEHPESGMVDLNSPICVIVTEAKLAEGVDSTGKKVYEVVGQITVLNTQEGQKLSALIDAGYNPLVSSRGYGSVIKDSQGIDEVQDDYVCEGWDVVMKPSFETAELWPQRESAPKPATQEQTITEQQKPAVVPPVAPAPVTPSPAAPNKITETMDLNHIKARIGHYQSASIPSDPKLFAEGLRELDTIHQQIQDYIAEDVKRGWQGQQLHEQVKRVEDAWSTAAKQPSKNATALKENYVKALQVTKAVGERAVHFKTKLSEALKRAGEQVKLIEKLTQRGQAWVGYANKLKEKNEKLEHRLNVACEALEILRDLYNNDVTAIGAHALTLEFKEKAQSPEIQKLLKEAKLPKHIVAIREQLSGKPAAPAAPAPVNENKNTPVTPAPATPATPAAPAAPAAASVSILVPAERGINESVQIAKRLSAAHNAVNS